jgi:hypothetical protein
MTQLPSVNQPTHRADPSAAPVVELGLETQIHAFWVKNRTLVLLACSAALLVVVGREGWQYFSAMHEKSVQEDYAKIGDKPDLLAAFADTNSGHALAGVASLQLADQKFEAADYKLAATLYTKAAGSLKNELLLGRARLGAAMSQISSGDIAAGEATLKAVGADQMLFKAVRAEATYHLASLASEAGRLDDVKKFVEEIEKIDLNGTWSQRAAMLLASLQTGGKPAPTSAPAITFKPGGR